MLYSSIKEHDYKGEEFFQVEDAVYDPQIGFVITNVSIFQSGLYTCEATLGSNVNYFNCELVVNLRRKLVSFCRSAVGVGFVDTGF